MSFQISIAILRGLFAVVLAFILSPREGLRNLDQSEGFDKQVFILGDRNSIGKSSIYGVERS